MSKFWLNLVILGFIVVGLLVAWDLYLTFNDLKGDFDYQQESLVPSLYSADIREHFQEEN